VSADSAFLPHAVEWTPEKSSRWWDVTATRHQDRYFSLRYGSTLVRLAQVSGVRLGRGRTLDFGCGSGHLLDALLAQEVRCAGADFSEDSVALVRQRLGGNPLFEGVHLVQEVPTPIADESFDAVFLVETVEHLLDDDLESTLKEIHRIVRPHGNLIVTTPNDERLVEAESICPDCGCIFHPVQHVRSWDRESLPRAMGELGFATVTCRPFYFQRSWTRTLALSALMKALRRPLPNLFYVGRKRAL
jgi:SAM-dependent methyltransferase